MDLLELGKLYGSRMGYHGNILLRTNGREQRQRQKSYFCRGTKGEVETESPFLWLAVLEFLAALFFILLFLIFVRFLQNLQGMVNFLGC